MCLLAQYHFRHNFLFVFRWRHLWLSPFFVCFLKVVFLNLIIGWFLNWLMIFKCNNWEQMFKWIADSILPCKSAWKYEYFTAYKKKLNIYIHTHKYKSKCHSVNYTLHIQFVDIKNYFFLHRPGGQLHMSIEIKCVHFGARVYFFILYNWTMIVISQQVPVHSRFEFL